MFKKKITTLLATTVIISVFVVSIAVHTRGIENMDINDLKEPTFVALANEVIDIIQYVITNRTYHTDEERDIIDKFIDLSHSENQEMIKKELMRIKSKYFANINFKNYDDPNNKILVNELLPSLRKIRERLSETENYPSTGNSNEE
ncbi:hypothetical protein ASG89_33800 [Paenibacillus sp. Soil766]|uniref:hypothetical protein n=1 Tax=Paenibacillus sp. Soil766 TaxID=1736404 RepID=UPI00070B37F7|nr:hypothetical protein [Paenibacillus sp. Soil766]KRE92138.1 hypothetical protein ASG89_33800 [Paenibacillus sp. Soil766]